MRTIKWILNENRKIMRKKKYMECNFKCWLRSWSEKLNQRQKQSWLSSLCSAEAFDSLKRERSVCAYHGQVGFIKLSSSAVAHVRLVWLWLSEGMNPNTGCLRLLELNVRMSPRCLLRVTNHHILNLATEIICVLCILYLSWA